MPSDRVLHTPPRQEITPGGAIVSALAASGLPSDDAREVLMTDKLEKPDMTGPGETEGGRIDSSRIPQEAQEEPALRVPKGGPDQGETPTGPSEPNSPPVQQE